MIASPLQTATKISSIKIRYFSIRYVKIKKKMTSVKTRPFCQNFQNTYIIRRKIPRNFRIFLCEENFQLFETMCNNIQYK